MVNLQESRALSDDEKSSIMELHKRLMVYERRSLSLDVESDDKSDVAFINDTFKDWSIFKRELKDITQKMKDVWLVSEVKGKGGYFG